MIGQRSVAERAYFLVEVGADPADFGLADAGVRAQSFDQVIDFAGRHPVQVGLHDHGEQCLIHAAAAFEQGRVERAGAQFRDPQLRVPGRVDRMRVR